MNLLTVLFADSSVRLPVTASFRKSEKESITKSLQLLVKRRAKLLVRESINNKMHPCGAFFIYIL